MNPIGLFLTFTDKVKANFYTNMMHVNYSSIKYKSNTFKLVSLSPVYITHLVIQCVHVDSTWYTKFALNVTHNNELEINVLGKFSFWVHKVKLDFNMKRKVVGRAPKSKGTMVFCAGAEEILSLNISFTPGSQFVSRAACDQIMEWSTLWWVGPLVRTLVTHMSFLSKQKGKVRTGFATIIG